ncbi:MAG: alpha-1,2-fucosyltransferase [Minisyncoccia bacterium]
MITVRLKGGLGNQMFQYALGRALSIKNNTTLGLDIGFYDMNLNPKRQYDLEVFNIAGKVLEQKEIPFLYRFCHKSKILDKITRYGFKEKSFDFDPQIFCRGSSLYIDGYWQSPKYFEDFEDEIRKDFTLKNPPVQNIEDLAKEIEHINSVCVHVRRGDYVGNKNHEIVDNEYYIKGIEYIKNHASVDKIYVFSDDIEWCKNSLKFEFSTVFVDSVYAGEKGEGHMFLMSKCKNFIIANSSFSWWAAWLSNNKEKIVICPKQWFPDKSIYTNDLIPKEWVRI